MAVRAQEEALGGLPPELPERARQPAPRKAEAFVGRVNMVELERSDAAVVAAKRALATRLLDQPAPRPAP